MALSTIWAVNSYRHPTIVSIGYEQRSIDELIEHLHHHGVGLLVDVRLNAISRKKGFSKGSLRAALMNAGIDYRHDRELGNPKENRDAFRRGLKSARAAYSRHLLNGASTVYQDILGVAQKRRIALLCVERDGESCHRSSILERAQQDIPHLRIIDV